MDDNVPAGTLTPPHTALLLPSALTVLEMIRESSSNSAPTSSMTGAKSFVTEKVAEATNRSLPWRTSALSLFPPRTRANAVRIMVLPAPVSPVRTFKPAPNSSSDWSIIPRFRIEISLRNERSLTAPTFYGKFKFCNKPISKESL